jgi:rhodanese-related sulfurtransferase
MKKLLLVFFLAITTIYCNAQQNKGVELVKPAEFAQKLNSGEGQLIDVRTPKEYKSGYIKGAVNMHLYDNDFEQRIDTLDKNKPVYVYCKVGGRSAEAVTLMKKKGFRHIIELDGGMDAWNEAKLPITK